MYHSNPGKGEGSEGGKKELCTNLFCFFFPLLCPLGLPGPGAVSCCWRRRRSDKQKSRVGAEEEREEGGCHILVREAQVRTASSLFSIPGGVFSFFFLSVGKLFFSTFFLSFSALSGLEHLGVETDNARSSVWVLEDAKCWSLPRTLKEPLSQAFFYTGLFLPKGVSNWCECQILQLDLGMVRRVVATCSALSIWGGPSGEINTIFTMLCLYVVKTSLHYPNLAFCYYVCPNLPGSWWGRLQRPWGFN